MLHYPHHTAWYTGGGDSDVIEFDIIWNSCVIAICLVLLLAGYFIYGCLVENVFHLDDRETPAVKIYDGVDYVVMPQWKLFLVQLLNIARLGPILMLK